ncbi:MAG TPA: DUF4175 family protein, partial [Blastocatellia bacterium]|nr:DUF4175 family protein [Blastocatellia bacterium]
NELIAKVRSRIKARHVLRGAAITLAVFALSLVLSAIAAGHLSHRPTALVILRFLPVVLAITSAYLFVLRPLRVRLSDAQIARLVEEKCALGDRLATSVEFSESPRDASPAIVARLVGDTAERCSALKVDRVVDPRQAYVFGGVAAAILIALVATIFLGPSPVSTGMSALYSTGESVSANAMFINVSPGTARAPRGSDQKIKASLSGFDSESAQVFVRKQGAENWVAQVMEPGKSGGEFQHVVFNIQDSVAYYVESNGVRSPEFRLEVADLPFVKQIDLVLNFPAYTRLASKKVENAGEIAALKGTVVHVIARMTGDPKSARVVVSDGTKVEMSRGDDELFVGQITVKQNGTYRIELTGEDGERYNGSNEYDITVLEDRAPTVVVDKPGRDMKVTSIQEIFAQVRADDDYGVAGIELYYSVNGGEEKLVKLQDLKSDSPKTLSGAHTFFLEEFGLQPGDFISYYAKARDNNASSGAQESTSDIYFLEVRPFDREFRQAQQQGGGGGGGDQESNALTRRQREIIAATFRVQRELSGYTAQEKEENFGAVTLSQEKLKKDAETLAERIRRRLGDRINEQPDFAKLIECVTQASKEMAGAIAELKSQKTKEALAPEQRALQQLLRAEAIFREMQIAQGNSQGQGGQQDEKDLADLFELQLDKMKNQYETVQREQQAQATQQQDEIARRLQELARRQQQQVEQRMRSQMQGGAGGGGSQRQQQEMIEEAEKLARQLEQLSRDRRDQKLQEAARQLQQSADEMKRSQAASSQASSSQSSPSQSSSSSQANSEAGAQAKRALERLEQARRMIESSGRAGAQQSVQQLRQQAEDALKRQDQIARGVEELARGGQNGQAGAGGEEKKEQLAERKQALADQIAGLERDIDQTARGMSGDRQQAGDKLREAAGAIRNNRIPDRIRQNNQMIENGWYEQARERERTIRGNIEQVLKNIQAAEGGASRRSQGESLEDALNRARELADNLESLRRRMESGNQGQPQEGQQNGQQQNGQQNGREQNGGQQGRDGERQGQPGQQQAQSGSRSQSQGRRGQQRGGQRAQGQQAQGQQSQAGQQSDGQQDQQRQQASDQQGRQGQQPGGRQGQQSRGQQSRSGQQGQQGQSQQGGSQQGGQQASQQGGQAASETQQATTAAGGPPRGGQRQLESEIRERLGEAEELRRSLGRNSDLARDLNHAIEQLRRINPNAFSDPSQLAALKTEVIDPLRQLEVELARRLQAKLGNNGSGAFSDGDAPDRYRKMIEDYYRRLSARSPESKP